MVYMELRLFSQFVAVNKMYSVYYFFSEVKYIINKREVNTGTYYLTAIIIEYAPRLRQRFKRSHS